jgi:hypothetical protein
MKTARKYYAFHYEFEHLWRDPKKRRIRVSKPPKEYQGPFNTKAEASQAVSRDARKYGAKISDYQIAHLTPAQFSRKWQALEQPKKSQPKKSHAQIKREVDEILAKNSTVATAAPYIKAINEALYHDHNPEELIVAVEAAKKHVAAMRRIGSGHIDASGEFDPAMYELLNLLVKANEMVRRIKIKRKTGRFPRPSQRTAWKLR